MSRESRRRGRGRRRLRSSAVSLRARPVRRRLINALPIQSPSRSQREVEEREVEDLECEEADAVGPLGHELSSRVGADDGESGGARRFDEWAFSRGQGVGARVLTRKP